MRDGIAGDAREAARQAAKDADVEVVDLDGADVVLAQRVIAAAWGAGQVPQENLLRALAHAGTTLLGAVRGDACLGVTFGFLGWNDGIHLHSHMTAVVPGSQSRGVGFALKLGQRALCLERQVDEIRWTYDPLISRNAYFNLVKLGADVVAFEEDHYGDMDDIVNAGDHSDRFEVSWRLDSPRVRRALARERVPVDAGHLVPIPRDYDRLRRRDAAAAREVRLRSRAAFAKWMAEGRRPEWSEDGYVFVAQAGTAEWPVLGNMDARG